MFIFRSHDVTGMLKLGKSHSILRPTFLLAMLTMGQQASQAIKGSLA